MLISCYYIYITASIIWCSLKVDKNIYIFFVVNVILFTKSQFEYTSATVHYNDVLPKFTLQLTLVSSVLFLISLDKIVWNFIIDHLFYA